MHSWRFAGKWIEDARPAAEKAPPAHLLGGVPRHALPEPAIEHEGSTDARLRQDAAGLPLANRSDVGGADFDNHALI
jgi:hypothetical protein